MVDLKITTYPNAEIVLQNEKVTKRLMSDSKGIAIFKGVKGGKYTATAKGKSKQITILDQQSEYVCQQVKDLPLKSKIKFSSGLKMVLMIKNANDHPSNSGTFVSEYIVDTYKMTKVEVFTESVEWQNKMFNFYKNLPWVEKNVIFPRYVSGGHTNRAEINTYFYMLSTYEVGVGSSQEYNLGFTDDASRIKKKENGTAEGYFLRDQYRDGNSTWRVNIETIGKNGSRYSGVGGWIEESKLPVTSGIVLGCDVSQDAYVALDSDGYYRILGM